MFRTRFSLCAVSGPCAASALVLWACSTETITTTQARPGDDAGVTPEGDGGEPSPPTLDAAPPPARSVKGTWEKVAVHPPDGDPIEKLSSVFVRGPTDVFATEGASNLGTGYYHYDGKRWTGVRYPGFASRFAGLSSGDLLGFGDEVNIKAKAGDAWEKFPQPQTAGGPAYVTSLWGTTTSNLYASSGAGNVRFDGNSWSIVPGLDTHSGSFSGVSDKDVWFAASGHGQLAHFDGTTWTNHWNRVPADVQKTPTDGPYGVFATGVDDVWAMGRRRTVMHYDGSAWRTVPGPQDEWGCDLTQGWASSKKNAWLVGKGGCVFHWDGAAWEKIPSGVTDDIYSIHGSDAEHVWMAPYSTTTLLRLLPE